MRLFFDNNDCWARRFARGWGEARRKTDQLELLPRLRSTWRKATNYLTADAMWLHRLLGPSAKQANAAHERRFSRDRLRGLDSP